MGYLSGNSGKILFVRSDATLTNDSNDGWKDLPTRVQNWTLNTTANLLDITSLGDYDRKTIYGTRTTTGTMRCFTTAKRRRAAPKPTLLAGFSTRYVALTSALPKTHCRFTPTQKNQFRYGCGCF